jgi:hypothetical protein
MIGAPLRGSPTTSTRVSGFSVGASAPVGAPALPRSDQVTNRPVVTEYRPVVGGTPMLPLRRQK